MRVVHLISGHRNNGAGRGAYLLHTGLRELGVDSNFLTTANEQSFSDAVYTAFPTRASQCSRALRSKLDRLPLSIYNDHSVNKFSVGIVGGSVFHHQLLKSADIINLHWVVNGPVNLFRLRALNAHVVWTLRDMWPFTGGCHYSGDCREYENVCGCCPILGSEQTKDLSWALLKLKAQLLPKDIVFVGISDWITGLAKRSSLLSGRDVRTIRNGIDTKRFSPADRAASRRRFNLPAEREIVLVGAQSPADPHKGFNFIRTIAPVLSDRGALLVFFGKELGEQAEHLQADIIQLGFLRDDELRCAYNAANVFVAPSRYEAFGKTLAEALACGTPVVCFDAAGQREIVTHKVTGYCAEAFIDEDLARGVMWVLEHNNADELSVASRKHAVDNLHINGCVEEYRDLYRELLRR